MGGVEVITSNRLEVLVEALSEVVRAPLASPFAKETILVPSKAMGQWLGLELSKRLSIWANPDFRTPATWLRDLTNAQDDVFESDALAWSIASLIPSRINHEAFADIARYLDDDHDGTKRIALSLRIATTFQRYIRYRPELVTEWTANSSNDWQSLLFHDLVLRHGATHLAARLADVELKDHDERLCLFHTGPLGPLEERALGRIRGHVHRFDLQTQNTRSLTHYVPVAPTTVLAGLQSSELTSANRPADNSITFHACHSPMRECEVLRDQLLAALQEDPTLEPRDILVLCPDLHTYASNIDAVFGGDRKAEQYVPYKIVDGSSASSLPVPDAFLAILDVAVGRLTATEVVDLLHREPIRSRFKLRESDIEQVRAWILDSGIRWAANESHREEEGQPAFRENTWRFGLDRLLLGYSNGADGDSTFKDVLPYEEISRSKASTLGALCEFTEKLFALRERIQTRAPVDEWHERLLPVLDDLLASRWSTEFQHQFIRDVLNSLVKRTAQAGFAEPVPLSVIRNDVARAIENRGYRASTAAGEIAFAALTSGRCTPARIVAFLGMNDGVFPQQDRALGFDFIEASRRPTDPSRRERDRTTFREAIFAARSRVIITFIGRSIRNDAERPPSVVVSELLDVIKTPAVFTHPLHAFSPRYFQPDSDVFSHAAHLCEAAKAMTSKRHPAPAFLTGSLPAPEKRPLTVDELCTFFNHPVVGFMLRRVGIVLGKEVTPLGDREPIALDGLDNFKIQSDLVERARQEQNVEHAPAGIAKSGELPLGTIGEVTYQDMRDWPVEMGERVRELLGVEQPTPLEVDVDLEPHKLTGWLRTVGPSGQVLYRFARLRGKTELDGWIRHLAMTAMAPGKPTYLLFKEGSRSVGCMRFEPVQNPERILQDLVDLYWLGQSTPLPLFPDPSSELVEQLKRKALEEALGQARRQYREGFDGTKNDYVLRLYGEQDPLDPAFGSDPDMRFVPLAKRVFEPLLGHLRAQS